MLFFLLLFIPSIAIAGNNENGTFVCAGAKPVTIPKHYKLSVQPGTDSAQIGTVGPQLFLPINILYVTDYPTITDADRKILTVAGDMLNKKLSAAIQGPRINEIRFPRYRPNATHCQKAQILGIEIPLKYVLPCYDAKGALVPEHGVNVTPASDVLSFNEAKNFSHVIFITIKHCPAGGAYASVIGAFNQSATHNLINFCEKQTLGNQTNVLAIYSVLLHETLHTFKVAYNALGYGKKAVFRPWMAADGTMTTSTRYVIYSPTVLKWVRNHFRCPTLEGAEISTWNDSGIIKPDHHWRSLLFSSEGVSSGSGTVYPHSLSGLSLGSIADTGLYDVDMSKAEPLMISQSADIDGCDIAQKSCHELIRKYGKTNDTLFDMAPYCDIRIDRGRCSHDSRVMLACRYDYDGCAILYHPRPEPQIKNNYDHGVCEEAKHQHVYHDNLGMQVGAGTICVTMFNFSGWEGRHAFCVNHECQRPSKLILKFHVPKLNVTCAMECRRGTISYFYF